MCKRLELQVNAEYAIVDSGVRRFRDFRGWGTPLILETIVSKKNSCPGHALVALRRSKTAPEACVRAVTGWKPGADPHAGWCGNLG